MTKIASPASRASNRRSRPPPSGVRKDEAGAQPCAQAKRRRTSDSLDITVPTVQQHVGAFAVTTSPPLPATRPRQATSNPLQVPVEVPNIGSITPGDAAWWKTGAQQAAPLAQIYLASEPLGRHCSEALPSGPFCDRVLLSAHEGRMGALHALLNRMEQQLEAFRMVFKGLQEPTIAQVDAACDAEMTATLFYSHAVVHTLVGNAPIDQKLQTLHAQGLDHPTLLADVRMMGLNLLHIACTMQVPARERHLLILFLKNAGVDAAGISETGLTPLHCLAAQADGVYTMPVLMGWHGGFAVDVNACNAAGETPLYIAYATQPGNTALTKWLRERGASVNIPTVRNETMLHAVLRHGDYPEVVRDLIDSGIGLTHVDAARATALSLSRQLYRPASLGVLTDLARERTHVQVTRPYLGSTEKTVVPPPGPMIMLQPAARHDPAP